MVMQVLRVRACDICGTHDDVARYRVSRLDGENQRTSTLDLCPAHGAGLEDALGVKPVARRKQRAVVPLDEVKAKSRSTRKAAKKAAPRKK